MTPELASNEFIYHKLAALLGLCTPEVKLFSLSDGLPFAGKRAAGIRFISDMKRYRHEEAARQNRLDYYSFQTLYQILAEEDSEEYYVDGTGRFLKIDNAASLRADMYLSVALLEYDNQPEKFREAADKLYHIRAKVKSKVDYWSFGEVVRRLKQEHGYEAEFASRRMFEMFADLDTEPLEEAFQAVAEIYSERYSNFYREFIKTRQEMCSRFLQELEESEYERIAVGV